MLSGDSAVCPVCGSVYPIRVAHCMNDGARLVQKRAQAGGMEGRVLDAKYHIGQLLGEGEIGATYIGRQVGVDRDIAVKLLRPAYSQDPQIAERFFVAARTACQLVAPSIATAFDFGHTPEGVIYIAMEYVRGRSLATDLQQGPLQIRTLVTLAIQVCDALAAAHANNVWHGEIKPANILIFDEAARRDVVKLADFGLARAVHPDVATLDASRLLYVAPEVADGSPVDGRADLYSLGCVLHHALTGKPPFSDTSTRGMIERHAREIPARLPREVPPNLAKLVGRLMNKSREARPENALAARNALHAVLGTTPTTTAYSASSDGGAPPRRGPSTGAHSQPGITQYPQKTPRTGPSSPGGDRTLNELQPAVLDAQTGVRPAPGAGTVPEKTALVVPDQQAPSRGIPRIVVILVVALILSGAGILVYVFAL